MAKFGVYIIESLRSEEFADGENLASILKLANIEHQYHWADSVSHFFELIADFKISRFKYLHISCHADEEGIQINGNDISNSEFSEALNGTLRNRRLFMSACRAANDDLAARVITVCGAYSLIGTGIDLRFVTSAVFWPAFYHVMKEIDAGAMSRADLKAKLKQCAVLFGFPIRYYSYLKADRKGSIRKLEITGFEDSPRTTTINIKT
ncbi:hypothetical protein HDE68_004172 [Pedobacter cryoconitis]|uniref:CHAT domain-containing protein n=1 Tax=Pedobacter cryoconitis TaxID=188932 RepID=A0A7W9E0R4_9SPHI|nr:hypothetical protein [Pedobacter cryoconitis]MBB5638243.1 hypothetical protein [Pedobacter cryoconitis]